MILWLTTVKKRNALWERQSAGHREKGKKCRRGGGTIVRGGRRYKSWWFSQTCHYIIHFQRLMNHSRFYIFNWFSIWVRVEMCNCHLGPFHATKLSIFFGICFSSEQKERSISMAIDVSMMGNIGRTPIHRWCIIIETHLFYFYVCTPCKCAAICNKLFSIQINWMRWKWMSSFLQPELLVEKRRACE